MNTQTVISQVNSYLKVPPQGRSDTYKEHLHSQMCKQKAKVEAILVTARKEMAELDEAHERLMEV